MSYAAFKNSVLGKKIGDGECVSLVVNNPQAYSEYLFPGVAWTSIFQPVSGARELFDVVNTQYFQKIANDASNASQLPQQGDVMVFSQTPYAGYTNTFNNPYGHTGICDSATSLSYNLLQQNAPAAGQAVNVTYYPWKFRHCIGWLRPIPQTPPAPVTPMITLDQLTQVFQDLLHRAPDSDAIAHYVGHYTYDFTATDVTNSAERKQLLANEAAAAAQAAQAAQEKPSEPTQTPPATPVEPSEPETPPVTPPEVDPLPTPPADNPPTETPAAPQTPAKPKVVVPAEPHNYYPPLTLFLSWLKALWKFLTK